MTEADPPELVAEGMAAALNERNRDVIGAQIVLCVFIFLPI